MGPEKKKHKMYSFKRKNEKAEREALIVVKISIIKE